MSAPTELALKPLKLRDVDVWFVLSDDAEASDNYKQHVQSASLTPTAQTSTTKTCSPLGVFTDVGTPTWAAALGFLQDWETPGSLSLYLFTHQGEPADLYFVPRSGGPGFRVAVPALVAGAIGGAGPDADVVATVSMGVNGRPELLTAADVAALTDGVPAP